MCGSQLLASALFSPDRPTHRPPASSQCRQLRVRNFNSQVPAVYVTHCVCGARRSCGLHSPRCGSRLPALSSRRACFIISRSQNFLKHFGRLCVRPTEFWARGTYIARTSIKVSVRQRERRPGRDFFISDFLRGGQGYGAKLERTMTTLSWLYSIRPPDKGFLGPPLAQKVQRPKFCGRSTEPAKARRKVAHAQLSTHISHFICKTTHNWTLCAINTN